MTVANAKTIVQDDLYSKKKEGKSRVTLRHSYRHVLMVLQSALLLRQQVLLTVASIVILDKLVLVYRRVVDCKITVSQL